MLVIGAGGHAKELLQVLLNNGETEVVFFDDLNKDGNSFMYERFRILKSVEEAKEYFRTDPWFVPGTGGTLLRKKLSDKLAGLGGEAVSVISNNASISELDVSIGYGVNIMQQVIIHPSVRIGNGTLVNAGAMIHHNSTVGDYCEISPSVTITGGCTIGDFTLIGTGAIILPGVKIGNNVIIGAGAMVNRDIPDGLKVAGVPAKEI